MRILFVVDGHSPIALNWIGYFVERGHEVHLVSTYACQLEFPVASLHIVKVAFSGVGEGAKSNLRADNAANRKQKRDILRTVFPVGVRTRLRQWLGVITLPQAARHLSQVIAQVQPDIIHAMRIPYEGMLAALAHPKQPLLISVWGNDFTLHAQATPWLAHYTRRTIKQADALHTDCQRDQRLAQHWGFPEGYPSIVLPGGGGVQMDIFFPIEGSNAEVEAYPGSFYVINPRGWRAYVRNDTFFNAIPLVLAKIPTVRFLCPAMEWENPARHWVDKLGIRGAVELLPTQTRPQMAELFRRSQVAISITTHDGAPNSLLEAMACGCFPIAGDLESIREWIMPEVNGLLVEPDDSQALAESILLALEKSELRRRAKLENIRLISERAEYNQVMRRAEAFYQEVVAG